MFKRRKPDEEPDMAENTSSAPAAGNAADSSIGVPPFRAAPGLTPTKEAPRGVFGGPTAPTIPSGAPRPPGAPASRPANGGMTREGGSERRTLVVGRGISVQGMVQDAERLVVEGQVEATMIHATELSVSPGGLFKGEVQVEDAEIAGTIDGTVNARGSLVVRGTGIVLGTARCRRLQVEDGGQITGRIEMITDSKPSAAPRPIAETVQAS